MCYKCSLQVIMLNKNIRPGIQNYLVYILLTVVTLAVFYQVKQYDFINIDDNIYVTENIHVLSGMTFEGFLWAFRTTDAEFWHPLTWLSLMFDSQLYGLNAGGYHFTNLILHILSTLLLCWLFIRMTQSVWKSAFVGAIFALHPLHVESVAWIAERKDVLSAFFWMLTLCLYVRYTEKPVISRHLSVLFSFTCALMSKAMVVTLPVIMILLDYWPLRRFESKNGKILSWQVKEKIPFFALSIIFSAVTLYAQYKPTAKHFSFPLGSRISNALVSIIGYPAKIIWPQDLTIYHPFSADIPHWQVLSAILLILVISFTVIVVVKRFPYLFVGWMWYVVTIAPVIGIIQISSHAQSMADRYSYLPSIGISIMLAWGIPTLFPSENNRTRVLLPAGIAILAILAVITWKQCSYWKNNIELSNHVLQLTKDPPFAYHIRGIIHGECGQYNLAINDFNEAIRLKPDYFKAYYNRGFAYAKINNYQRAVEDYGHAIKISPDYAMAYAKRGIAYYNLGQYPLAVQDLKESIRLNPNDEESRLLLKSAMEKEKRLK